MELQRTIYVNVVYAEVKGRAVMKFIFSKWAFIFLSLAGLLLWVLSLIIDERTDIHPGIVWLPFVISQTMVSAWCGILIKKLRFSSNRDPLTGLANRGYFQEKLDYELKRLKRTRSNLTLAMLDIDNFKSINDKYGHLEGDRVLKQIANILRKNMREVDVVARWGGEEFAIIMPETDSKGALIFIERIRKIIEGYKFKTKITVSAGIASTKGETNKDNFVSFADDALYVAKNNKNEIVVSHLAS